MPKFWNGIGRFARILGSENFYLSIYGLIALLLLVTVVWGLYGFFVYIGFEDYSTRGQSGDMFGGITALFSGLAFAGLIYTLFIQKKELQYQREELSRLVDEQSQTKEHLETQAQQMKQQSSFIEQQIFENSFFQLLSVFNSFVANIQYGTSVSRNSGADALEKIYISIHSSIGNSSFDAIYERGFERHKNDLGPYFRLIYNILKFLKESRTPNPKFYSNILRAQLSNVELLLLMYNGASIHGREKMAPLMKEFDILKHVDAGDIKTSKPTVFEFYRDWSFLNTAPPTKPAPPPAHS